MSRRVWDLEDLIEEVKFILNANTGQTDQAARGTATDPDVRYRNALNEAYADEVDEAMQVSDVRHFLRNRSLTWPASQKTLNVGTLAEVVLHRIEDITDQDPGTLIWFDGRLENSNWFWLNRDTIQWGVSGPTSARTLRFTYVEEPSELKDDADIPEIIPRRFRHILAWSAAIILRIIMDEEAPRHFVERRNGIRLRYHKSLQMGRPIQEGSPGAGIDRDSWDVGVQGGGIGP
jgi:hypothetical protein